MYQSSCVETARINKSYPDCPNFDPFPYNLLSLRHGPTNLPLGLPPFIRPLDIAGVRRHVFPA